MQDRPPLGTDTLRQLYSAMAGKLMAEAIDRGLSPGYQPPRPSRRYRFFSWLGRFFDTLAERYR